MSDSECEGLEEGVITTVQTLIQECEKFVVHSLAVERKKALEGSEQLDKTMKDACAKISQTSEEMVNKSRRALSSEMRELENRFLLRDKNFEKMLEEKDKIIEANRRELDLLKASLASKSECKCKDLFIGYVKSGAHVFGKDVLTSDTFKTMPCSEDSVGNIRINQKKESASSPQETSMTKSTVPYSESQVTPLTLADNSEPQMQPKVRMGPLFQKQERTIVQTLEEIPDCLREAVGVFYKDTPLATNEKLSCLQKAYLRYFLSICDVNRSVHDKAVMLKANGIRDGIWSRTFCPPDSKCFVIYLKQRIKNEIMQKKMQLLRSMSSTQQSRLKKMKVEHDKANL